MNQPPQFSSLKVSTSGEHGFLQLSRPSKLNALSLQLLQELTQAAAWFDTQERVRVVVVEGEGKAFSAGADLSGFPDLSDRNVRVAADAGRVMADAIEGMRAVTIAKIHGWCVGGGLVLAAACDLRIAADSAQFSIPEIDLGIPLAWGGIPRLVREIGPAKTKELVMTCRKFSAQEANSLGFLNDVMAESELDSSVLKLANEISAKPNLPITVTKRHVNAVSEQMGAVKNAWSDADGLLVGLLDAECQTAREAYVKKVTRG